MIAIINDNRWINLENVTPDVDELLYNHFAAEDKQARYIDCVEEQSWDGVYRKYSKQKQRLSIGFLKPLVDLCNNKDIPLEIEDQRDPPKYPMFKEEDVNENVLSGITLMPHQVEGIKTCAHNDIGLFWYTTGAGKCLAYESKILMNGQEIEIGSLFNDFNEEEARDISKFGLFVLGPNGYKKIQTLYKTNKRTIVEIELSNGSKLKGVPEHKVFTKNGWKTLQHLDNNDEIYTRKSNGVGNKWTNNQQKEKEIWEKKRATSERPSYSITVCVLPKDLCNEGEEFYQECRKTPNTVVPQMFTICGHKEIFRNESGQEKTIIGKLEENDQKLWESDEEKRKCAKGCKNLQKQIWSSCSGDDCECGPERMCQKGNENQKEQWNNPIIARSDKKIQKHNEQKIERRIRRNKKEKIKNLEEKSQHEGIYKRVIQSCSSCTYEEDSDSFWDNNISEQIRAGIHSVVREIEFYIESRARTNNTTQNFMVFIRFSNNNKDQRTHNRNKIKVLIRDEEGRDITKETGCESLCKEEIDEISANRMRQAEEYGFIIREENWQRIVNKKRLKTKENCYDIQVDDPSHSFWSNNMLSHNTELMCGIAKLLNCPTVIIAEERVVVDQIRSRLSLRDVTDDVGVFYAGKMPNDQLVCVGSLASLMSPPRIKRRKNEKQEKYDIRLKGYKTRVKNHKIYRKLLSRCELLMIDEADKAATNKQYRKVVRQYTQSRYVYGFTGTLPMEEDKLDQLNLTEVLGSVIAKSDRRYLERIGRIIPVKYIMKVFGEDNRNDRAAFDIAVRELIEENTDLHQQILKITQGFGDENFMILVENIKLGEELESKIPNSQFIHGKTSKKKRDKALKDFEEKELKILIGSKILKRGLDLRGGIDNLILAASSRKDSELEQKVGRAVRLNERGWARVFDFMFINNYYLYKHSRRRLKRMVQLGYPTIVAAPKKILNGEDVIKKGFNLFRYV